VRDATGKMILNPKIEHLTYKVKHNAWDDPDKAAIQFKEEADNFLKTDNRISQLSSKEGRDTMLANYQYGVQVGKFKPGLEEAIQKHPITQENIQIFEKIANTPKPKISTPQGWGNQPFTKSQFGMSTNLPETAAETPPSWYEGGVQIQKLAPQFQ